MTRLFLGAFKITDQRGWANLGCLNCVPLEGTGGPLVLPPVVRDSKAACRLALSQGPGFLPGSHAAEKLEEWKYLDQMARE